MLPIPKNKDVLGEAAGIVTDDQVVKSGENLAPDKLPGSIHPTLAT